MNPWEKRQHVIMSVLGLHPQPASSITGWRRWVLLLWAQETLMSWIVSKTCRRDKGFLKGSLAKLKSQGKHQGNPRTPTSLKVTRGSVGLAISAVLRRSIKAGFLKRHGRSTSPKKRKLVLNLCLSLLVIVEPWLSGCFNHCAMCGKYC